ncbi:MAG: hypothetical protein VYE46_02810 [Cyanobacteriota bacterium]|nr:hypothetical protein [Cyanobacteriota bacterium]
MSEPRSKPGFWEDIPYKNDLDELVAVMGKHDHRHDWVLKPHPTRKISVDRSRDRTDYSRRHNISLANSPVGNWFEKKKYREKYPTRQDQIHAFRVYVWSEWIQKGNIPDAANKWLIARAQEVNAGRCIDLVSDGREFSRKRLGWKTQTAPYDCHGHVLRAVILIFAGKIKPDKYFSVQAEYLLKMEGDEIPKAESDQLPKITPEEFKAADANRSYETPAQPGPHYPDPFFG